MTESTIIIVVIYLFLFAVIAMTTYSSSNKNSSSETIKNNETPATKTIWDKLRIVSIVLSAIAALIISIVKLIEVLNKN